MQVYQVGGSVRDEMLGLVPKDLDYVVVGAIPQQMEDRGFQQVGADFPVFLHPQTNDEYALARKERKVGAGYYGFEVDFDPSVSLEDDLLRRDLTINAMAKCCDTGQFVDPFDGLADLQQGVLRHVSDAFREDPVRVLRTARFAARYQFDVADQTMQLMVEMVQAGELDHLVPERVQLELEKALLEPQPELFFRVLEQCDALSVVMPELEGQVDRFVRFVQAPQFEELSVEERFAAAVMELDQQQRALLFERVKAPKEAQQVGDKAARMQEFVQQQLDADLAVRAFEKVDAFRRPDHLFSVGRVLECAPRCGSVRKLLDAFELARQVSFADLSEEQQQTLQGPEVRQALRQLQVERVKQVV